MPLKFPRGRPDTAPGRSMKAAVASALVAVLALAGPGAFAQPAPATEPEHLAALHRPSSGLVAGSPHGRLAVDRLAGLLRKRADGACVVSRKLDEAAFDARARELLIAVIGRIRSHHDGAVGDGALATFRERAGGDVTARIARLRGDEAVGRFLGLLASRDSGEIVRDALEHIAGLLETRGAITVEQKAALMRPDAAIEGAMERLDVAIDDFLEANRSPGMVALRELQDAARAAVEGALDQARLAAFDRASLAPIVSEALGALCLGAGP